SRRLLLHYNSLKKHINLILRKLHIQLLSIEGDAEIWSKIAQTPRGPSDVLRSTRAKGTEHELAQREPPAAGTATSCRAGCMTHILWARKQAVLRNIDYDNYYLKSKNSTGVRRCCFPVF